MAGRQQRVKPNNYGLSLKMLCCGQTCQNRRQAVATPLYKGQLLQSRAQLTQPRLHMERLAVPNKISRRKFAKLCEGHKSLNTKMSRSCSSGNHVRRQEIHRAGERPLQEAGTQPSL